jgi:nucleoside-diphosphate-sugar epimerase
VTPTLTGRTVLVTGGTGFIGGRLVEMLVREHQARVRVLVRDFGKSPRIARFPIQMIRGDLTDGAAVKEAMRGCEVVFHCAHDSALHRDAQAEATLRGTRNLCRAVLEEGVPRMVHVSSYAVYGPTLDGEMDEHHPWQPCDHPYVEAKRAAERMVLDFHAQHGLPVVVVQPTIVYGPFCKAWTLRPVLDLKTGLVPLVDGGGGHCNAVYVDEVVDALLLAATRPDVLGEVFLISGDEPVTWKTFYGAFEAVLGVQATIEIAESELRRQMVKKPRSMLQDVKKLIRHPKVQARLKRMRVVRLADRLFARAGRTPSVGASVAAEAAAARPLHIPRSPLQVDLYRAKTTVRIDKAKARLGYLPRHDFAHGMELTGRYIRWANLDRT